MAGIYEALMHASKQRGQRFGPPAARAETCPHTQFDVREEMFKLVECIESLLPKRHRIVQFIGSREGEGTAAIARELAGFSASRIGLSVLLMSTDMRSSSLDPFSSRKRACNWLEAARDPMSLHGMIHRFGPTNLFICPPIDFSAFTSEVCDPPFIRHLFDLLRESFDLTVIQSAPTSEPSPCADIIPDVDGVFLVCESEKAEWTMPEGAEDIGLALVLSSMGQGSLSPQQVVRCMGIPVLMLTPP